MKKNILKSMIFGVIGCLFTSCFSDLDTMPLDDNQLVGEKVYQTADGYTGVLAKCYSSLILTGQKGGDGGDGDIEGANEGYSGYVRLMFYLQELPTDNFIMPSSSNGLRKCLNLQWDESNASVIRWTYQRLYMSIAYCNEMLRECTESKLKSRGLWDQLGGECASYRAEARFIRAYCYSMLCDLFGNVPYIDENTGVKDIPVQWTRKQIFDFAESELKAIDADLKAPGTNVYGRIDQVAAWFLLSRMYLNAETWIGENRYNDALMYAKKVINDGHYPLAPDYRTIFLADNDKCKEIIWPLVQDGLKAQSSAGTNFYVKAFVNGPMNELYTTGIGSRGWGNVRSKTTLVDAFDADDVTFDKNDTWGNQKKDKRAQFMTALPNQRKETWDEQNNMTSTYNLRLRIYQMAQREPGQHHTCTGRRIFINRLPTVPHSRGLSHRRRGNTERRTRHKGGGSGICERNPRACIYVRQICQGRCPLRRIWRHHGRPAQPRLHPRRAPARVRF